MFPLDDDGYYCSDSDCHFMETWHAMEDLVDEGLTRTIGLSNFNLTQVLSKIGFQSKESVGCCQSGEQDLVDLCVQYVHPQGSYFIMSLALSGQGSTLQGQKTSAKRSPKREPSLPPGQGSHGLLQSQQDRLPGSNTNVRAECDQARLDVFQAYSALGSADRPWRHTGSVTSGPPSCGHEVLTHPTIMAMSERLGRTSAQVVLRWHLQMGGSAICKSVNPQRIKDNYK